MQSVQVAVLHYLAEHDATGGRRSAQDGQQHRRRLVVNADVNHVRHLASPTSQGSTNSGSSCFMNNCKFLLCLFCVNVCLLLNTFNILVLSYKSIPLFRLYFIVSLRANQRLYYRVRSPWWIYRQSIKQPGGFEALKCGPIKHNLGDRC